METGRLAVPFPSPLNYTSADTVHASDGAVTALAGHSNTANSCKATHNAKQDDQHSGQALPKVPLHDVRQPTHTANRHSCGSAQHLQIQNVPERQPALTAWPLSSRPTCSISLHPSSICSYMRRVPSSTQPNLRRTTATAHNSTTALLTLGGHPVCKLAQGNGSTCVHPATTHFLEAAALTPEQPPFQPQTQTQHMCCHHMARTNHLNSGPGAKYCIVAPRSHILHSTLPGSLPLLAGPPCP